ncbi:MAG TPA: hypothetical protein VFS77_04715 [Pyrinomonadaceae bacterium]|nr:hypothetical protein [Pyrinomonadaceae bacterium]
MAVDSVGADRAEYLGAGGTRVLVEMVRFRQDAKAYEALSLLAGEAKAPITADYGTAGFARENEIAFFKGAHFVRLRGLKGVDAATLNTAAGDIAKSLDKGEADIPVLIKHLPNPDEAQKNAIFLHSFANLDKLGLQHGVLTAIDSRGNADAALASYGPSKVLVVEFNTPQLAKENDDRIIARIQELWKLGQPAPTAYRREGNYSVFVFDAPDDRTAKQLIDQVKYEQVVSWLGENPNILKQAQRHYINTTLGVLVAVLKASGYALVACLGLGGLFGALLFTYRRNQQKDVAAYSDAGGMLRLNLDDLTVAETDPSRLLRDRN